MAMSLLCFQVRSTGISITRRAGVLRAVEVCESFTSLVCLLQVQSTPLQQAYQWQHLHRDRLREVPHLPGESWVTWNSEVGTGHKWLPLILSLGTSHHFVLKYPLWIGITTKKNSSHFLSTGCMSDWEGALGPWPQLHSGTIWGLLKIPWNEKGPQTH
jgi:hypothetical protein